MYSLQQLRTRYKSQILQLATHYGARNVRLFGSVARGDMQTESDIDFLVEFEPQRSLLILTFWWNLNHNAVCWIKVDY